LGSVVFSFRDFVAVIAILTVGQTTAIQGPAVINSEPIKIVYLAVLVLRGGFAVCCVYKIPTKLRRRFYERRHDNNE